MKKYLNLIILLVFTFSCTNQTINISPSNKTSILSTPNPQIIATPTPQPTTSQDENISNTLYPILAFGNPFIYNDILNGYWGVEYDKELSHIFYMNDKVLNEGITKETVLNKDIIDVTEGFYPEYSPDNNLISFINDKDKRNLYIMKAGDINGKTKKLISELNVSNYSWINNSKILFSSGKNLYILDIETKSKEVIMEDTYFSYSLSPNKKKIAILVVKSSNQSKDTFYPINRSAVYQSFFIYDIETKSRDNIIEDKLLEYVKFGLNPLSFKIHYYFNGNFKWNENNEDIAFAYDDSTRIVNISTKTKELIELFDLRKIYRTGNILKIFYYNQDGDLIFNCDPIDDGNKDDNKALILSLKNTPINQKASLISEAYKSTEISTNEYSEHIYFFTTPFEGDIGYIDLERYFEDKRRTLSYEPYKHKNIFPYSFLH
jgi:hypothetical protein